MLMDILCRYCQNWKHEAKDNNVRIRSWVTDCDQVSHKCAVVQRHRQVFGFWFSQGTREGWVGDMCMKRVAECGAGVSEWAHPL